MLQVFNTTIDEDTWQVLYSDSANKWPISGLNGSSHFVFRVKAKNAFGWSNFSDVSRQMDIGMVLAIKDKQWTSNGVILGVAIPVFIVLCAICGLFIITLVRRPWDKKLPIPSGRKQTNIKPL
jgi:hypothetical protein